MAAKQAGNRACSHGWSAMAHDSVLPEKVPWMGSHGRAWLNRSMCQWNVVSTVTLYNLLHAAHIPHMHWFETLNDLIAFFHEQSFASFHLFVLHFIWGPATDN
jgi:hypothetical protein